MPLERLLFEALLNGGGSSHDFTNFVDQWSGFRMSRSCEVFVDQCFVDLCRISLGVQEVHEVWILVVFYQIVMDRCRKSPGFY